MSVLESFDLSGKTALVTGCKRGIGRAMAEALAEAGADVVGVSATLEPEGSEIGEAVDRLAATTVETGAADAVTTILTGGLGKMFGDGGAAGEGLTAAAKMQEEAAQEEQGKEQKGFFLIVFLWFFVLYS